MTSNQDFSEDVIVEILSRLPVKSLIRYRFVCQFWYSLIKSPTLISRHLKNYKDENTCLLVQHINACADEPSYILFSDQTLTDLSHQELKPLSLNSQELLGPYNGLFIYHDKIFNRIFLWNIATREFRALPKCKNVIPRQTFAYHCNVGFELDLLTNDYKIVFIRSLSDNFTYDHFISSLVALYTLSTNSWKYIKAVELTDYSILGSTSENTYLEKVCYWLAWRYDGEQVILSFHMGEEVFQEIKRPDICYSSHPILGVHDDSLHLLGLDMGKSCFDIWVMQDKDWIRQLTIGPILGVCKPLGFWKNGAFFMESSTKQLLLYDPNTSEVRDLGIDTSMMIVHSYKESLISIKWEDWVVDFFDIPWHILGVY